jgi:hypothetical protein
VHLSKEDVNPPTQKIIGTKSFKTTMIFRPECHSFHKSAFVMVINGYLPPFDVTWWLLHKVSGHHLSSPPPPLSSHSLRHEI